MFLFRSPSPVKITGIVEACMSFSGTVVASHEDKTTIGRLEDFSANPLTFLRRLWQSHGDVALFQCGPQKIHFAFDPTFVRQVLGDSQRFHSQFFAVRGPRNSAQRRLTSGLLTMNGDGHKQQRRIVMQVFQKKAVAGYHDAIVHHAVKLLNRWSQKTDWDISAEMTRFMLQLTSSILFGFDIPDLAIRVGELTERWVDLNHQVGFESFDPDTRDPQKYEELLSAAEELEIAIRKMIQLRIENRGTGDVLSLLLNAHEEEGRITEDELIGQIALLFGAAHLTSSHTFTWVLFLLAQHPEVMAQLHCELKETLNGRLPTQDDLGRLNYLEMVIKESMRILPASAYSQRVAAEDMTLGPFHLNRGSIVIFSQLITHHMPELFESPEDFIPERWDRISPSPYAYFPFGAGARMCVGATLGMMQFKITLSILLSHLKFTLVPGCEINAKVLSTMLFPDSEVPVRIEANDGQFQSVPVKGNIHTLVNVPLPHTADAQIASFHSSELPPIPTQTASRCPMAGLAVPVAREPARCPVTMVNGLPVLSEF